MTVAEGLGMNEGVEEVPTVSLSGVFTWVKKDTKIIPVDSHIHVSHKE